MNKKNQIKNTKETSLYTIIYDCQIFQEQRFGGISRYFCEIIRRLDFNYIIAIKFSTNYYLTNWHLKNSLIPLPRFIFKLYSRFFKKKNYQFTISTLMKEKKFLFHPTYYAPYFLNYIGENPYVITVHDMIHEKLPHLCPAPQTFLEQKKDIILKANRIIAISENTKKDIIDILGVKPEKIDVIYHGTSMKPFIEKHKLKLPEKYLLFVGDRTPYKNFQRFMDAFADLHEKDPELYIVYTGSKMRENEVKELSPNILNYAIHIKASDKELCELYSRALLFVYPSLYEGFGIPILEAYACHCPIAISNTSCFPEIAGDAAAYFNPYSKESICKTIKDVIYDEEKRNKLTQLGNIRLKRYSWSEAALKTQETYKKAIESINK